MPAPSDEALRLSPLTAADAEPISQLHARCFETAWSAADFLRLASETTCHGILAIRSGVLVGFVLAQLAGDDAEILTIAVDPHYRRSGIAAALLAHLAHQLARHGAAELFLEVNIENEAALALYARSGFSEAGRRPGYYRTREGARDALILKRRLAALPLA